MTDLPIIYTWGYRASRIPTPLVAVQIAKERGIYVVVDVRAHRGGRAREWAGRRLEEAFTNQWRDAIYLPLDGLGNPGRAPDEWAPKDRDVADACLGDLAWFLGDGHSIMLVCACADPMQCHRRFVAAELSHRTGAQVVHLNGVGEEL